MKNSLYFKSVVLCFLLLQQSINQTFGFIPQPNKVVIVVLENHAYSQILGSPAAPYLNGLLSDSRTAFFTNSYGISHPSQPNYLRLFSGSNQGTTNGNLPRNAPFNTPNLGSYLINASKTFIGYSEDLPYVGFTGVVSGAYARKHSPWVNWQGSTSNEIPDSLSQPFTSFPTNYNLLPDVSFVIPNQDNDMHNGSDPTRISIGDTWIQNNLDGYIQWAKSNNSLLILTFDEDDNYSGNHIFTFFIGQPVKPGNYSNRIDHYNILRTLEDMYFLPHAGASATAAPIDYCWDDCTNSAKIIPVGPVYYCKGDSVLLTASNGLTYLWSTGDTTQSIYASGSDNYRVTITDGFGCTATSSFVETIESDFKSLGLFFKETMDTVFATTTIAAHEINNGFDNDNLFMSGTSEVRPTIPSLNYSGASGGSNIYFTNLTGKDFIISGINTSAFVDLQLSFGIYKSRTASNGLDFLVQVSSDGINYTTLTFDALPTGTGTAIWHYRTATGIIPSTANLRIRFIQNGNITQYRIDDVTLNYSTGTYSMSITAGGPTTFCKGDSVTLNATPINSYSWSNGNTTQNITVGTSGNYFVFGTLQSGCVISSNSLQVNSIAKKTPVVNISTNIGNSICSGDNVIFSAISTYGGITPSFQWRKNGFAVGSNSNLYASNGLAGNDVISCIMTSNETCVSTQIDTSNIFTMIINQTVFPEVTISNDFADTLCSGENVTFTASPLFGGSSPSYLWKKNGSNVGSNSSFYSSSTLVNGDVIYCRMTSSAGCASPITVTSNSFTMVVYPSVIPQFTIASNSGNNICAGNNALFTALPVNGGLAPIFQWKKNGISVGANTITYSNNSLVNNDTINCVMISSAVCPFPESAASNSIIITVSENVNHSVSISASTGSAICSGTNVIFTANSINGGNSPMYQWKKNGLNVGINSNTFSTNTLNSMDAITCFVTSNATCPSPVIAVSNSIVMTVNTYVNTSVSITTNNGNTFCAGVNEMFTALAVNGGVSPSYQWKKNGNNVGTNSNIYSDNALADNDAIVCIMTSNAACVIGNPASSNTKNIILTHLPSISGYSPSAASSGVGIVISGTNFTGITSVTFNGSSASYVVNSSVQITAFVPAAATSGYIVVFNNCGNGFSGNVFTVNSPAVVLNLKIFIEGYYLGGGQMKDVVGPGVCDTVTVELHDNVFPYNTNFISRSTINTSGNGTFNFPLAVDGSFYYLAVYNHNSLQTWSSNSLLFSSNTSYDFTTSASQAFGNNLKNLGDGNFALYSGDVTHDGIINIFDFDEIKTSSQLFRTGYIKDDLTGDFLIESSDFSLIENNIGKVLLWP